jgi:hypothetical protein
MSIDEVMTGIVEYGIEQRRATINESTALRASIRAAINRHVAEEVAREREVCAELADECATWGGSNFCIAFERLAAAIRARAETT